MKKKTASNPLKFFNDNKAKAYKKGGAAMKAFKKSLPKAQGEDPTSIVQSEPKPIGADFGVGKFSGGFSGMLDRSTVRDANYKLGFNNTNEEGRGLTIDAGYTPSTKKVTGSLNYNTTLGKNKVPLKVGLTYNKKGGNVKRKKK